jgi:hypothetical protein
MFPAWRYHALFTDSPSAMIQAEEQHRDHAQVEQVLADLPAGWHREQEWMNLFEAATGPPLAPAA